jgi:hypothetical protein
MTALIQGFAVLTLLAGVVILLNPQIIFGFLRERQDELELHVTAVFVRLALGILLIMQSPVSRYPLVIEVIGWLSIAAAIFLGVMGRRNFIRLMSWALSFVHTIGRLGGILAAAFGSFLLYAFS